MLEAKLVDRAKTFGLNCNRWVLAGGILLSIVLLNLLAKLLRFAIERKSELSHLDRNQPYYQIPPPTAKLLTV